MGPARSVAAAQESAEKSGVFGRAVTSVTARDPFGPGTDLRRLSEETIGSFGKNGLANFRERDGRPLEKNASETAFKLAASSAAAAASGPEKLLLVG
jgi:hypothetical protein